MNINKSDFKIVFNKMMNSNNQNINEYINNLNINGKTGNEELDKIVKNYNPSYILKVMNKINNKVFLGGNNQTEQVKYNNTPSFERTDLKKSEPDYSVTSSEVPNNTSSKIIESEYNSNVKYLRTYSKYLKKKAKLLQYKESELMSRENKLLTK